MTLSGGYELKDRGDYATIFSPLSNSSFIQYFGSNIGLFSLASYKAIALKTIATASCRSYSLLKAITKREGKIIAASRS